MKKNDESVTDKGEKEKKLSKLPYKMVFIYMIFGLSWILFSDRILSIVVSDIEIYSKLQTYKGFFYVLVTAGILYEMLRYNYRKMREIDSELVTKEKKLFYLAYFDEQTNLGNKKKAEKDIKRLIEREKPFILMDLDLDDFRVINEIYGHKTGDDFVKFISSELKRVFGRENVYRWSGDEFLILLGGHGKDTDIQQIKTQYIDAVRRKMLTYEYEVYTDFSTGITTYPDDGISFSQLIKNASLALNDAKDKSRIRISAYNNKMRKDISAYHKANRYISYSINNNKFELNFQPIVNIETGKTEILEVLVRLPESENDNTSVEKIIEIAEKTNKVEEIDKWVIINT